MSRATGKVLSTLDKHCRAILARSTFCIIGTQGPHGGDVSPRGDPPGLCACSTTDTSCCRTASATTASTRWRTCSSIRPIGDAVSGAGDEPRRCGSTASARVTDDAALLAASAVQDRAPKVGILIEVREAFLHCAKSTQPRRAVGPFASDQSQRIAKLWRHARRSGRRPHQGRERAQGAEMARRGCTSRSDRIISGSRLDPRSRKISTVLRAVPTPDRPARSARRSARTI